MIAKDRAMTAEEVAVEEETTTIAKTIEAAVTDLGHPSAVIGTETTEMTVQEEGPEVDTEDGVTEHTIHEREAAETMLAAQIQATLATAKEMREAREAIAEITGVDVMDLAMTETTEGAAEVPAASGITREESRQETTTSEIRRKTTVEI